MPSFNEITGSRISSGAHVKGTDKEAFASGWDLLWGKKEKAVYEEMEDGCCHKTVIDRCEGCPFKEKQV